MEAPGTPESDDNNELSGRDNHNCVPIANVGRIMKRMVPEHVKITKDSKELVQQCVSEFICFITGEASERCKRDKRKTINGEDIIASMTMLGFEEYIPPLKRYLEKYNQYTDRTPKQQQHPSSRR